MTQNEHENQLFKYFKWTAYITIAAVGVNIYSVVAGHWDLLIGQSLVICPLMTYYNYGLWRQECQNR